MMSGRSKKGNKPPTPRSRSQLANGAGLVRHLAGVWRGPRNQAAGMLIVSMRGLSQRFGVLK